MPSSLDVAASVWMARNPGKRVQITTPSERLGASVSGDDAAAPRGPSALVGAACAACGEPWLAADRETELCCVVQPSGDVQWVHQRCAVSWEDMDRQAKHAIREAKAIPCVTCGKPLGAHQQDVDGAKAWDWNDGHAFVEAEPATYPLTGPVDLDGRRERFTQLQCLTSADLRRLVWDGEGRCYTLTGEQADEADPLQETVGP